MFDTIYHGSSLKIESPIYGKGSIYNDYGQGFYCTPSIDLGSEWAVKNGEDGYLNKYSMDDTGLKILRLDSADFTFLHWITILLKNRTFELEYEESEEARQYLIQHFSVENEEEYDIITGYRADDSYFMYAEDFLNAELSYDELKDCLTLGELGIQVVLKSKKAFQRLKFIEETSVSKNDWFDKFMSRDSTARQAYKKGKKRRRNRSRTAFDIDHILMEGVKANDPRL